MDKVVPDIFNTLIIQSSEDALWDNSLSETLSELDTLVISSPFTAGSNEEIQLQKMLGACKLSQAHYQVLQLQENQLVSWHQLKESTKATKVLLLGILPAQLGIVSMMAINEINNFNKAKWMPTVSLTMLLSDNNLKQHLWTNVLKPVYFS